MLPYKKFVWINLLIMALCMQALPSAAQISLIDTADNEPPLPEWPSDSLERRTPRGTVAGFLNAVANRNYEKASHFLAVPPSLRGNQQGAQLAHLLQLLLDREGHIMPYSWISKEFTGDVDDNLPEDLDRVGTVTLDGESISLFVESTKSPDGAPVWLFSSETVKRISTADIKEGSLLIDAVLPPILKKNKLGGVPIGQWLVMLLLIVLTYLMAWVIIALLHFTLRKVWSKADSETTAGVIKALTVPLRLFLAVILFVELSQEVGISIIVRQWFSEFTAVVGIIASLMLLWRLTEFIGNFSENRMNQRGHVSGVSLVLFLRRLAKFLIVIFGIIAILSAVGIDVTTGLAALGIGGIALALGAQKTVENFVGSVMLIADRPIRVGDFCKAGDTLGTVESIGMRSTQIRTLDRTVVTIPNGEFSSIKIENYTHRDKFRFYTVFAFRYETTTDQMRYLLVELRSVLYAHPKVDPEPARVRLVGCGADSLNVEIFALVNASDFNDFVEVREDLLLRMMDVVEASGTGFAFPSRTLYMARDKGMSEDKTQSAEEKVKEWREKGEMQIPGFSPERMEQLKNTISYPPEGSSRKTAETTPETGDLNKSS